MSNLERIMSIIEKEPPDLNAFVAVLNSSTFSKEELMTIAIEAVKHYELYELDVQYKKKLAEAKDDENWYIKIYKEYEPVYLDEIKSHPLVQIIELLLKNGLDPNTSLHSDGVNVMLNLRYVDRPFLAATVMRLLLEHGADPYIRDDDGESLFWEIDGDMAIDINMLPDDIVQSWFQCWIVMIGYGARSENAETLNLNSGHTYDELIEFEFFDFKVRYEPDKKENIMHIYDIRNNEEIGWL